METDSPIGVFDSGVGGLTVLKELLKALPEEQFIYFGDTARLPYGEKSAEAVIRYSIDNAQFLMQQGIKMLIVACSTASSQALESLQKTLSIPVLGVIEPGAEAAVEQSRGQRIAILGTRGTIRSEAYQKAILRRSSRAYLLPIACPLLVPLVEEGYVDHPAAQLIVQEYLSPIKEQRIDTLVLGCTHYPLLKHLICQEAGEDVAVVDSALSSAQEAAKVLEKTGLKRTGAQAIEHLYFVSDDPQKFESFGSRFCLPLAHVALRSCSSNHRVTEIAEKI